MPPYLWSACVRGRLVSAYGVRRGAVGPLSLGIPLPQFRGPGFYPPKVWRSPNKLGLETVGVRFLPAGPGCPPEWPLYSLVEALGGAWEANTGEQSSLVSNALPRPRKHEV